jgi:DNA-binding NarL/FixJ family response regulator
MLPSAPRVTVVPLDSWDHQAALAYLAARPEVRLVDARAEVFLALTRRLDTGSLDAVVAAADARGGRSRVVVVTDHPDDVGDLPAGHLGRLGVSHVLPRRTASWDDVVAALADRSRRGGPVGTAPAGPRSVGVRRPGPLTDREVEVLRMLADGSTTAEIGAALHYSERTIKNVLGGVLGRLGLRNRVQAVAYATRLGAI